jgi:predicted kinase
MQPKIDTCISRHLIRFGLLKEGEDYFSHEETVKYKFFESIKKYTASDEYENIYIDATHLTPTARKYVMRCIPLSCEVIAVSFEIPLEVALERNSQRTGLALVPESAIRRMRHQFIPPILEEGFNEIWRIDKDGNIKKEISLKQ